MCIRNRKMNGSIFLRDLELLPMTHDLRIHDLDIVKANQHAKYLVEGHLAQIQNHPNTRTDRRTHTETNTTYCSTWTTKVVGRNYS